MDHHPDSTDFAWPKARYFARVAGEQLAPMHKAGDLVCLDPDVAPLPGDTVLLILAREDDDDPPALADHDAAHLAILQHAQRGGSVIARQWRPARILRYRAGELRAVHKVISMNEIVGAPSPDEIGIERIRATRAGKPWAR